MRLTSGAARGGSRRAEGARAQNPAADVGEGLSSATKQAQGLSGFFTGSQAMNESINKRERGHIP